MLLRDFLFKIHLCKGIGIAGKYKIYQWAEKHFSQLETVTVSQLIMIAQVKANHQAKFVDSYQKLFNDKELGAQLSIQEKWLCICDDNYPLALKEAYLPPIVIFYRGNINLLKQPLLAIVGPRQASQYSLNCLKWLIPNQVNRKITIVSGLAKGVDTWAHQITVQNQGTTIAVIGTGLDIAYPAQNKKLQTYLAAHHLVISEYPNGTKGYASHFPERNRIIAGLVETILVTEAKSHSGSLITANLALQNNRNVLAIPGPINSPLSVGTNELIAAGAKPVIHLNDLDDEFLS